VTDVFRRISLQSKNSYLLAKNARPLSAWTLRRYNGFPIYCYRSCIKRR